MFMAMIDQTIVAAALPSIAASFGDIQGISWVVVVYLIASTVAAPVYGRLGDVFGRRRLMLVAMAIFTSASVMCAAAPNIVLLVVGRAIQGLGGGGLITLAHALVGQSIPPRERGRYQGYLSTVMVTSTALGPVIGGLLAEHFGWRAIFLVHLPLGCIAALLVLRLPGGTRLSDPFRFDFVGLALLTTLVASLVLMIGPSRSANSATFVQVAGPLAVAAAAALLLWRREAAIESPLLPVQLFKDASIWRSDLLAMCHGATLVSLLSFTPLYLVVGRGMSFAEAGVLLLPFTVCVGLGAALTGRLVTATGRTAIFPSVGTTMIFLLMTLLGFASPYLPTGALIAVLSFSGMFMGAVMSTLHVIVLAAADRAMLGTASGTLQLSRALGAALGTALVGSVLFWALVRNDPEAAGRIAAALSTRGAASSVAAPLSEGAQLQSLMNEAFRYVFYTIAAIAMGGSVLGWTMPVRRVQ